MSTFRTCPDCGGLLDPTRPNWISTIDLASARQPEAAGPAGWQCLICGYEEGSESEQVKAASSAREHPSIARDRRTPLDR